MTPIMHLFIGTSLLREWSFINRKQEKGIHLFQNTKPTQEQRAIQIFICRKPFMGTSVTTLNYRLLPPFPAWLYTHKPFY